MHTFTAQDKPADIVKIFPKASDLFKQRRIDFCCNGNKPLADVFLDENYDGHIVLDELNQAYADWKKKDHEITDWDSMSYGELVDHIVHKHHAFLNEELPALDEFVTKVFRVHGSSHAHLKELHRLYNAFKTEMEGHMVSEESDVFPLIKEYGENPSTTLLEHIIEA
ncbi:MAG TPA: DUF542 domain-containing protein, partial [Bacillota bacterium]|nr:DUF542 domain-containing protein [Bacillota bacterium]